MHQHSKRSNTASLNASASSNASFDPDNACTTDTSISAGIQSTIQQQQTKLYHAIPVRSVSNLQQIWNTVTCIFTIANGTWGLTSGYWGLWANLASCRNANCESAEMRWFGRCEARRKYGCDPRLTDMMSRPFTKFLLDRSLLVFCGCLKAGPRNGTTGLT
jgi:hypothetical protein